MQPTSISRHVAYSHLTASPNDHRCHKTLPIPSRYLIRPTPDHSHFNTRKKMYTFYIHCPLPLLLVLFLLPLYLHHTSLHHPHTTRTTTTALLVYHNLLLLFLHHSPIANWLLAGATYVIAMRLLTCIHLPLATNPLYTPSNTKTAHTIPILFHLPLHCHQHASSTEDCTTTTAATTTVIE